MYDNLINNNLTLRNRIKKKTSIQYPVHHFKLSLEHVKHIGVNLWAVLLADQMKNINEIVQMFSIRLRLDFPRLSNRRPNCSSYVYMRTDKE